MSCRPFTLVVIVAGLTGIVAAQGGAPDWPQWRGPNRDGVVAAFTAAEGVAGPPDAEMESGHRASGTPRPSSIGQSSLCVLTAGGRTK